jgi:hypothetical protein
MDNRSEMVIDVRFSWKVFVVQCLATFGAGWLGGMAFFALWWICQ